jgi:hypothetical protein
MKDRTLWQMAWRAAHALGAAGLVALAAMLFLSLPVRAQAPQMDGVEPCLATHFDPARYLADLGALGWQPIAPETRGAALSWLSDAFLPLSEEGFDYAGAGDPAPRRAEQLQRWDDMTAGRNILMTDQSPNDVFHASSFMQGAQRRAYLEQLYAQYAQGPERGRRGWRQFFEASGMRRWMRRPRRRARPGRAPTGRRSPPTTGPTR